MTPRLCSSGRAYRVVAVLGVVLLWTTCYVCTTDLQTRHLCVIDGEMATIYYHVTRWGTATGGNRLHRGRRRTHASSDRSTEIKGGEKIK